MLNFFDWQFNGISVERVGPCAPETTDSIRLGHGIKPRFREDY